MFTLTPNLTNYLVRCGNGEGNNGLAKLSQALKKLIEEAIEKATKSLNAEKDKLECPVKYKGNESTCQFYQKKIDELKSQESPQSGKSKNGYNRKDLEEAKQKCAASHESNRSDAQKKAYEDIEERQKQLDELKDKLKIFTKEDKSDGCKKLLENLCDGLEKFLGFDKDSKGYTGQGIVYSDLDRLCDAVMAFLLKCLEGNTDLLTHYNTYVPQIIHALKRSIGKGSGVLGFGDAIERIQRELEEYESELGSRIGTFEGPLKAIENDISNVRAFFDEVTKKSLQAQVSKMASTARRYESQIKLAEEAYDKLDKGLKDKLKGNISAVSQAVKTFKEVAERTDVKQQAKAVDMALITQKDVLNKAVFSGTRDLQSKMDEEFNNLKNVLEELKEKTLRTEIGKVRHIVLESKQDVTGLIEKFDGSYKKMITTKFGYLFTQAGALQTDPSQSAQCQLMIQVNAVINEVHGMEELYRKKLMTVKRQVDLAVTTAVRHLSQVDDAVKQGLINVKDRIKSKLQEYIGQLGMALKAGIEEAKSSKIGRPGFTALLNKLNRDTGLGYMLEQVNVSNTTLAGSIEHLLKKLDDNAYHNSHPKPSELFTPIQNALNEATEAQLQQVIKGNVREIAFTKESGKDQLMTQYYQETMDDGDNSKLRALINQIKGPMKNDGFTGDGNGAGFKPEEMNGYIDRVFRGGDGQGAKSKYQWAIKNVSDTIKNLENLPRAIEEARVAAGHLMDGLRKDIETIQERIKTIDRIVDEADQQLQSAIESAQLFLNSAQHRSNDAASQLRIKLLAAVSSAFSALTHQVQFLFAKQKQAELVALDNFMREQLAAMTNIIEKDQITGLKGYLGKMKNDFVAPINDFASECASLLAQKTHTKMDNLADVTREQFEILFLRLKAQTDFVSDYSTVEPSAAALGVLLDQLHKSRHFNYTFSKNLAALHESLTAFNPSKFENGKNPLILDIVRQSITGLHDHLEYAYVSKYSEQTVKWRDTTLPDALALDDDELTEDAMKCANVFCSIISTLYDELSQLSENCKTGGNCEKKKIDLNNLLTFGKSGHTKTDINPLGHFLKRCGYRVASLPDVSNAELLNKPTMMGSDVFNLLVGYGRVFSRQTTDDSTADESVMYKLLKHLHDYYKTCHLGNHKSTKHPSTVRDMLHWLCGLLHNPVLGKVEQYFKELFQKPDALKDVQYAAIDVTKLSLAGTTTIQPYDLTTELHKVCSHSEKVLIAILGYGHAGGRYACEFNTNPDNLDYPTDPSKCFDWLVEVLVRLHHQLSFLYNQCGNGTSSSGWLDCLYGKDVGGSSWRCNELKCTEPRCGITCKRHPRCGMKSPLQSFLEDGLPGFLSHKFEKPDCKITCALANHYGIPCKTPMGFADISTVASHTMKGQHMMKVLAGFCSKSDRPLTKLCSYLLCVLQRPPQTLDEMYAFYYNFIHGWGDLQNCEHKSNAFNRAVNEASFNRGIRLDITRIADNAAHGEHHVRGDFFSLVSCNDRSSPVSPCGPYLHPLSLNVRCIYSKEHADKYLSWIVYLTETFYNALCRLLSKCEENCGANISKCRSEGCASDCQMLKLSAHSSSCQSIIQCPYTLPGLYTEGIVFGNTTKLGGRIGNPWKRSCGDFIDQLKKVCRGKTILAEYVHIIIPDYLFKIRAPFLWTTAALWLLSLLYLLHIMVIRLDLLHIKSHLHSPSSHRIAAQSLLAAARVNKLAKLTYLQP